jgi:hypothetical protein
MGFWERSKDLLDQGIMSSKDIFETTKTKTKELGGKGVIRFEIGQLERQVERRFAATEVRRMITGAVDRRPLESEARPLTAPSSKSRQLTAS